MGRGSKLNGILIALRELTRLAALLTGGRAKKALSKGQQGDVRHQDQYEKQSHRRCPEKNTVQPGIVRAGQFKFIRFNAKRIQGSRG